jgi:hypothetical protein
MKLLDIARAAVKAVPQVIPYLNTAYKTQEYFLARIEGLVSGLYSGNVGGEFIDVFANLISGQLLDAYERAYADEGYTDALPEYLQTSYQATVSNQYGFVDQFYRDTIDARIDKTGIDPLLSRAQLWAQRWTESYNEAVRLITLDGGGNLVWVEGDTMNKCSTCLALDGIVASAKEWDQLGVKPQNAPNHKLECLGWKCECSLQSTDKRRSRDAYGRIEAALMGI